MRSLELGYKDRVVLDYVLAHVGPGECPFLKVSILGLDFYGLLDSGANKNFVGEKGWNKLKNLGVNLDPNRTASCTVANNDTCLCIGIVCVPVRVRDVVKLIDLYIVPELRHELILGIDFWVKLGIVPDMRKGEWYFSDENFSTPELSLIQCEADLDADQQQRLDAVVFAYFDKIGDKLGCTSVVKHKIVTNSEPIKQRYYPVSPYKQKLIDEEVDKMLAAGVIERSTSAWSSPVLLVPKRDGTQRFCVDFRRVNGVSLKDAYPLPYISATLDKLGGARYLSSLDLQSAYWQVELEESSKQYTAFTVPGRGLFQFCRLPFGLHNAPATFQRLIDTVLGPELQPYVFCYLDDIIVVTPTFEKHIEVLAAVFQRLERAGLTLNKEKSKFCRSELKYLGYVVNRHGISVDADKIRAISDMPNPKNVTEVRRVIGTISWYRKFVLKYSDLIAPLTRLLRKGVKFVWDESCERSFQDIKNALISAPILTCPNFEHEFVVATDASNYAVGAILSQFYDGREHVICYISRTLSRQERLYSATERELLAVLFAVEKLRCYLEYTKFTVITDHYSLKWLDNLKDPQGRLGRWALRLQQFDFTVVHRKGCEHWGPDLISRAVPETSVDLEASNIQIHEVRDKWYVNLRKRILEKPLSFPQWRVSNDKVFKYVAVDLPELREDAEYWKLVIPKEKRREVLHSCHDTPTGGHLGVHKTYHKVARLYYWPCLKADVARYVKECLTCQRVKPEQKLPAGHMGGHVAAHRIWQIISMDIFGPLPKTKQGHMYIFVVTDTFSKMNRFFAIRRANAQTIVRLVEDQIMLRLGVPEIIRTDNGSTFKNRLFEQLTDKYGTKVIFNPYYHPSPNLTERVNRVLKTMISAFVTDNHRTWDENLVSLECAVNSSVHQTTGRTPYFLNHGCEMILHGSEFEKVASLDDGSIHSSDNESGTNDDPPRNRSVKRVEGLAKLRNFVARKLEKAHLKTSDQYNLRRRDVHFPVGSLVWKRLFALSDAGNYFTAKLAGKFEGPYKVKKKCGYCVYELEDKEGKSRGRWHVQDLKPYFAPTGE